MYPDAGSVSSSEALEASSSLDSSSSESFSSELDQPLPGTAPPGAGSGAAAVRASAASYMSDRADTEESYPDDSYPDEPPWSDAKGPELPVDGTPAGSGEAERDKGEGPAPPDILQCCVATRTA